MLINSFVRKSVAFLIAAALILPAGYTPTAWAAADPASPGVLFTVIDTRGGVNKSYYVTKSFIDENPALKAGPFDYTDINNAGSWRRQSGVSGIHLENLFTKLGIAGMTGSSLVEFREGGDASFFRTFTWGYITAPRFTYPDMAQTKLTEGQLNVAVNMTGTKVPAIIKDESDNGDLSALSLIFGQEAPNDLTRSGFVSGMKGGTITILSAAAGSFSPVTIAPKPPAGTAPEPGAVPDKLTEGTQLALIVPGGGSAYFTLDGTEPTRDSYLFNYAPQNSNQGNTAFFWPTIRDPGTGMITLKVKVFGADRMPSVTASFTYSISMAGYEGEWTANPFTDVKEKNWFYGSVRFVFERDLMNGTSATQFSPNAPLTRGMVVTILYRLAKSPDVSRLVNPFEDVRAGHWYTDAVKWAAENNIVTGYGNGRFGPGDNITREQMASILHRYAKYAGYDASVGGNTNILGFEDASKISGYAVPAMQWACGAGIIQGSNNKLDPKGSATRAQVAAILERFVTNIGE